MIFGGPDSANRFARGVGRVAGNGVRHVGRASGRAANRTANRYPLAVGIIVLVVLAMLFFGNH
ncbi:MAG: hypothetical protein KBC81_01165 [Candidatus Pacebacteria bacterium]|nr:hypothetical protein [Candidatus Paceibacterota bacterium]